MHSSLAKHVEYPSEKLPTKQHRLTNLEFGTWRSRQMDSTYLLWTMVVHLFTEVMSTKITVMIISYLVIIQ
jgi:hypothetical protein